MSTNVVFTVGSVLRGDDAAGCLLAKLLEQTPAPGWTVIDGGQTPEDELAVIRRLAPDFLLLVDAAEMGLKPGEIRRLSEEDITHDYLLTTHTLPLTFLLEDLKTSCREIVFLGIQIAQTEFFTALTPEVHEAVLLLYQQLAQGGDFSDFEAACHE